jgi:DNA-binding NarL/FixJ family response regulator
MTKVCVSIFSDDRILREGLRTLLSTDNSLSLVDLPEQVPPLSAIRAAGTDVLLLDVNAEGSFGLCERLTEDGNGPAIVFFAVPDDLAATRALAAGARGILQRTARSEDVVRAVGAVARGQVWASRHVIVSAWLGEMKHAPKRTVAAALDPRLTAREQEVLHHAAAGRGNREVAGALAISEATVKAHLTRIFQKLGLHGRNQLAAAYHGVASPAPVSIARHSAANANASRTTFGQVVRRRAN